MYPSNQNSYHQENKQQILVKNKRKALNAGGNISKSIHYGSSLKSNTTKTTNITQLSYSQVYAQGLIFTGRRFIIDTKQEKGVVYGRAAKSSLYICTKWHHIAYYNKIKQYFDKTKQRPKQNISVLCPCTFYRQDTFLVEKFVSGLLTLSLHWESCRVTGSSHFQMHMPHSQEFQLESPIDILGMSSSPLPGLWHVPEMSTNDWSKLRPIQWARTNPCHY